VKPTFLLAIFLMVSRLQTQIPFGNDKKATTRTTATAKANAGFFAALRMTSVFGRATKLEDAGGMRRLRIPPVMVFDQVSLLVVAFCEVGCGWLQVAEEAACAVVWASGEVKLSAGYAGFVVAAGA
jgi:hypothetical protein